MTDFITRLEELDKAATPGPWFINQVAASPEDWRIRREGDNRPIIRTTENEIEAARAYADGTIEDTYRLIVHLRNHVPEIIALVKAAREVVEGWAPEAYDEMPELQRCRAALEALAKPPTSTPF